MTYADKEQSVEAGQPVELFTFQLGADAWRYTSAEDTITFGGQQYVSRQITRSKFVQADGQRRNEMKVTLPSEDVICKKFIGVVPGQPMYISIVRIHRGEAQAYNLWTGRILGARFMMRGAVCELNGLTSEAAFNRNIPKYKYQGLCNNELYDDNCGVSKAAFTYTGTVTAVSGNVISVQGLEVAKGDGWALGGYVSNNDVDYRAIVAQSGDQLTLSLAFNAGVQYTDVDVFAGCDHTLGTCESKFSNNLRYGGFAFVPTLNPFQTSLR